MTHTWPMEQIEEALGGAMKPHPTKANVHELRITNKELGIRLKLELAPEHGALRLWVDRDRSTRPTFMGRCDWFSIVAVEANLDARVVAFRTSGTPHNELVVSSRCHVLVVVGIDPTQVAPLPTEEETPTNGHAEEPDVVTLIGKLGRPRYAEPNGIPFWTAGLGTYPDGAAAIVWESVKAFRGVAKHGKELERGQMVKATGRWHDDEYTTKEGETRSRRVLALTYIEPC